MARWRRRSRPTALTASPSTTTCSTSRPGCRCWRWRGPPQRVRVGVAAVNPFTCHPINIAGNIALIDEASNGRAYLGLARGGWLDFVGRAAGTRPVTALARGHGLRAPPAAPLRRAAAGRDLPAGRRRFAALDDPASGASPSCSAPGASRPSAPAPTRSPRSSSAARPTRTLSRPFARIIDRAAGAGARAEIDIVVGAVTVGGRGRRRRAGAGPPRGGALSAHRRRHSIRP